jgi:formylglycine-generating enzyme required for sulfatase activity
MIIKIVSAFFRQRHSLYGTTMYWLGLTYPAYVGIMLLLVFTGHDVFAEDERNMVFIPAGEFTMGTNYNGDDQNYELDDARPAHQVYLDAFWIDKYDVTMQQYMRCVKAKQCAAPSDLKYQKAANPVTSVRWSDAQNYCHYVRKELPTEAQWEKAARGPNGFVNPWGDKPLKEGSNQGESAYPDDYPWDVSGYGVYYLGAGFGQWVADWYGKDFYTHSPYKNPLGPDQGYVDNVVYKEAARVIRGRGNNDYRTSFYAVRRSSSAPNVRMADVTFRCAKSANQKSTASDSIDQKKQNNKLNE